VVRQGRGWRAEHVARGTTRRVKISRKPASRGSVKEFVNIIAHRSQTSRHDGLVRFVRAARGKGEGLQRPAAKAASQIEAS
jgi:hypothetical protein